MLHYSNASSIEENRRYLVIKGGLAWLLWQEGGVIFNVVEHTDIDSSLGSIPERSNGGGTQINNRAIKTVQSVTWQYAVLGVP